MTALDPAPTAACRRQSCRSCGGVLDLTVVDLGTMPPANSLLADAAAIAGEVSYPLCARLCGGCWLVQLDYDVPPEILFKDYVYFSSYSDSWVAHARRFAAGAIERWRLGPDSLVVELASNDGYLLRHFVAAGVPVLGIDPSATVAAAAEAVGVPTLVRFFGAGLAAELAADGRFADLIVANNVLAHVPDLNDFLGGIRILLRPEGTVSFEFPHLLTLIEGLEFDTIYHEHYSYFSLIAVEAALRRAGLRVRDVEALPTHGGSLRVAAGRADGAGPFEGAGYSKVLADERTAGLDRADTYRGFAERVEACRSKVQHYFRQSRAERRVVAAYGAAAKGATLLNFCGLTAADLVCVADRNPHKQGKLLPGSHVPVVAPETLLERRPDDVLILPWNLQAEIAAQLGAVRAWGGRLLVPIPEPRQVVAAP